MTWFTNTATDYQDMSDQILDLVTGQSLTAVINAAGTGYSVGDVLTVSGGTSTQAASFEVTTVGGSGEVTAIRQHHGGSYTVNPGTGAATTVAPSGGSGCTLDTTMTATGWTQLRALKGQGATQATINNDGTSGTYAVNDILTVVGGTFSTAATVRVTAVTAGAIDSVSIETPGTYTTLPSPATDLATTGGGGSGATVDLVFHGADGEYENIVQGAGGGSDEIYCGWRTYENLSSSAYNWELAGMDGYSANLSWQNQPNKSPGEHDDQTTFQGGAYFLLANTTITYWASVTPFRIIVIAKVGATYSSMHIGWLNRFGTVTEIPYPMYIAGQTNNENIAFTSGEVEHSSIGDPIAETDPEVSTANRGPGLLRLTSGNYITCANSFDDSPNRDDSHRCVVYPAGTPVSTSPNVSPVEEDDRIVGNGFFHWSDLIPYEGEPGNTSARLRPTPNTGGDLALPVPCTVLLSDITLGLQAYGEIEGLYWVSGSQGATLISEDTITIGSDRYLVFQSGLRTEAFAFYCLKES